MADAQGLASSKEVSFIAVPSTSTGGEGGVSIFEPLLASTDVHARLGAAPIYCIDHEATSDTGDVVKFTVPLGFPRVYANGVHVMRNGDRCSILYSDGHSAPGVVVTDLVTKEVLDVCNSYFDMNVNVQLANLRRIHNDPGSVERARNYNEALQRTQNSLKEIGGIRRRADVFLRSSDQLHDNLQGGITAVAAIAAVGATAASAGSGLVIAAIAGLATGAAENINNATRIPIPDDADNGGGQGFLPLNDSPVAQNVLSTGLSEGLNRVPRVGPLLGTFVDGMGIFDDEWQTVRGHANSPTSSVLTRPLTTKFDSRRHSFNWTDTDGEKYDPYKVNSRRSDLSTIARQAREAREHFDDLDDQYELYSDRASKEARQFAALCEEGLDPREELREVEDAATDGVAAANELLALQRDNEGVVVRLKALQVARYACYFLDSPEKAEAEIEKHSAEQFEEDVLNRWTPR